MAIALTASTDGQAPAAHRASLREGAWLAGGQLAGALATVAGTRAITQVVDPVAYGAANLLQNLVALLRGVFVTPLLNAGFRFFADAQAQGQQAPLVRALRRDLLWLSLAASPLLLALLAFDGWQSALRLAPLMLALLFVDALRNLELTMVSAARRQRLYAAATLAEACLRPVFVVVLAAWVGSASWTVLAGVLGALLVALLACTIGRGGAPTVAAGTLPANLMPALRRYALELAPYGLMSWLLGVSDRYIIAWLAHDAAQVGIYAAAYALVSQPFLMLNGVLAGAFRPPLFAAASAHDAASAQRCQRQWLLLAAAGALAGWLLTALLATPVTRLLLGPGYRAAAGLLPWIALGHVFFLLQQVTENRLLAAKRSRSVMISGVVAALLAVAVTIPLVMHYGMSGAAYACPLYFAGQWLCCLWLLRTGATTR